MDLLIAPSQFGPAAQIAAEISTHVVVALGRALPPSVSGSPEDQTSRFGIGVCRMYQREASMGEQHAPTAGQVGDALWISDKNVVA